MRRDEKQEILDHINDHLQEAMKSVNYLLKDFDITEYIKYCSPVVTASRVAVNIAYQLQNAGIAKEERE